MRILQLTPGTGNFYCGSCLRDNALVRGLRARGHEVLMVPLYLPHVTDEPSESIGTPIFLNGISVFLEQKFPALRHLPEGFNRLLSSPTLLRLVANLAGMNSASRSSARCRAKIRSLMACPNPTGNNRGICSPIAVPTSTILLRLATTTMN